MESLPSEILEKIFRDKNLSFIELSRLSTSCKRFKEVGDTNDNWMIKFQLVYPQLFKHLPLPKLGKLSWKQELKKRLKIKKIVRQEIDEMADKYFTKTELSKSDFHMFDDILVQHHHDRSNVHLYITDELSLILKSGTDEEELTAKYYSGKCIQHVKHAIMRPQVSSWPAMEDEGCLSYEAVLVQVALWCQPSLLDCTAAVARALDSLAARVLGHLATSRPKHPIFRGQDTDSADTDWAQLIGLLPPVASSPGDTMWSAQDTRDILASTNHILYEVEGFTGNKEDYYNPNNSYINVILETKQGIPITLSLLYTCILARLGVVCLPINFPGHFMLKWLERPDEAEDRRRFTFIDAFAGGRQMSEEEARELVPHLVVAQDSYQVAGPLAVAQRMLRNLISIGASRSNSYLRDPSYGLLRSSLELMLILNTSDTMQYGFMLSRVYLQLSINHEDVMSMLQDYRDIPGIGDQVDYLMNACQIQMDDRVSSEEKQEPKRRGVPDSCGDPHGLVSFHVGQVCRHKKYNYICVIHGWDMQCTASKSWIHQMGVDKLQNKDKQPFYNVLVSDGSNRYAAQENLEPVAHQAVTHPEVGKYFHSFSPRLGYGANKQSREAYPDDRQQPCPDTEPAQDQ